VLIDDDHSFVACGQAKNILYVLSSENSNFKILSSKCGSYQPEGYKFLRCVLATEESSSPEKRSESLFRLQFKLKKDAETYEPDFRRSRKIDDL